MMIPELSAPILGTAIRFDEIRKKGAIDSVTWLPSLEEMFTVLSHEFNRAISERTKLSFSIIEIVNADSLLEQY